MGEEDVRKLDQWMRARNLQLQAVLGAARDMAEAGDLEGVKRAIDEGAGTAWADAEANADALAQCVLVVAANGGMPDTFWATDPRVALACRQLNGMDPAKAREWARAHSDWVPG